MDCKVNAPLLKIRMRLKMWVIGRTVDVVGIVGMMMTRRVERTVAERMMQGMMGIGEGMVMMKVVGKIAVVWMRNGRMMMRLREIVRLRRVEGLVLKRGMLRMLGGVRRRVHMDRRLIVAVAVAVRRGKTLDILRLL